MKDLLNVDVVENRIGPLTALIFVAIVTILSVGLEVRAQIVRAKHVAGNFVMIRM